MPGGKWNGVAGFDRPLFYVSVTNHRKKLAVRRLSDINLYQGLLSFS